jgi:hypothetical protein
MNIDNNILGFKKAYGEEIYREKEQLSFCTSNVQLKSNSEFIGVVKCLWLPSNENRNRKNDLWWVEWNNGKFGIVEEKDVIII